MPTEPATDAPDPLRHLLHGPPDLARSLRPPLWLGIGCLAVVMVVAAIAIPPLIHPGDDRQSGSQAPPATADASTGSTPPTAHASPSAVPTASTGVPASAPAHAPPTDAPAAPGAPTAPRDGAPRTTTPKTAASKTTGTKSSPSTGSGTVSVQAENSTNAITGGAAVAACSACDGGARVRYLGHVTVYLTVPTAGTRTVTVTYEVDGQREIKVTVNNAAPRVFTVTGTSWDIPKTFRFTAAISAGRNAISFYNDAGGSPDIDKVTIS
ncbi:hypothetical protein ACN27G_19305 [Plantactinospora sp. WMMB334]|uniref:hypothetical protein n=1 Tax=Plantactinospora sp. WMMB334 TaxID=3404119 RepID=UPI003B94F3FC